MRIYLCLFLVISGVALKAQEKEVLFDYSIIKPAQWHIPKSDTISSAFEVYDSSDAFLLHRNFLDDKLAFIAYPGNLKFKDGTIDADIASPAGGGFIGLAFRIKDAHHYETVYFRPGMSRSMEAMQYMPSRQNEFNWWSFTDRRFQSRATIPFNKWFHVQLLVKGSSLTVFVNREARPVFIYTDLDSNFDAGSVGFWLGNCNTGAYKNLVIKAIQ